MWAHTEGRAFGGGWFSKSITKISLTSRIQENCFFTMPESFYFNGIATFGDKIVLVRTYGDGRTVLEYDITKNKFKKMGPFPYNVSNMAIIKWADNFVIIGGLAANPY